LPVGNSDRGVGLGAGEIMLFSDLSYQKFDWWHAEIPDAYQPGTNLAEEFEHEGLFTNKSINLGLTIGLSDYWNVTLSQILIDRCMEWEGPVWASEDVGFNPDIHNVGDSKTVHHRSECASTDFIDMNGNVNAFGGYLGDTKINFKYLLLNQGKGPGSRMFIGAGLTIPKKYTLTDSPWSTTIYDHDNNPNTPNIETFSPHRHFYLSDGAYKISTEIQFFRKRIKKPVFWGGTFSITAPINKSDYGYKPSTRYELSLMALSGPIKNIETNILMLSSIGLNFTAAYTSPSEWDNKRTPNSEAVMYIPGISFLFTTNNSEIGTFGLNFQRGYEKYMQNSERDIEETNKIYSISISYRKLLDKYIDKLYWK